MDSQAHTVIHVQQSASWDCGIACVKMVLRSHGKDLSLLSGFMKEIKIEQSVYTIDLACILLLYGFSNKLYTLSFEVDDGYMSMPFYKPSFQKDKERVDALFRDIHEQGGACAKQHLSSGEISELMDTRGVVVVALVDWNLMSCVECGVGAVQMCTTLCSKFCCMSNNYQGHFILVTGIDLSKDEVTFHNPSRSSGPCYCSLQTFNKGREARGTDEDLLVVQLPS